VDHFQTCFQQSSSWNTFQTLSQQRLNAKGSPSFPLAISHCVEHRHSRFFCIPVIALFTPALFRSLIRFISVFFVNPQLLTQFFFGVRADSYAQASTCPSSGPPRIPCNNPSRGVRILKLLRLCCAILPTSACPLPHDVFWCLVIF